jgi:tetratricopeptide (TPR) repeat protein
MKTTLVLLSALAALGCSSSAPLPPKAIALNRDGAAALAAGDVMTAEARFALAVEYNPRFTEAWVNLGLVEMARGNLDLAYKDFVRARSLNPDLPTPHHALGLLADKRAMGEEAERHYRMALKVDPGFAPARVNLGRRLFARRAFDDAREQFLRLVEVAPASIDGWLGLSESLQRLGREDEADDVVVRARARFGDAPELMLLVARQLLRRGVYDEAEATLAPLTRVADPARQRAAWDWIAVARLGRGDTEGAIKAANEVLQSDKSDPVARYVLANTR